jgi:hypothetical protein
MADFKASGLDVALVKVEVHAKAEAFCKPVCNRYCLVSSLIGIGIIWLLYFFQKIGFGMLRQLGTPTWFWTLTSRGYRQLDLLRILSVTVDKIERTDAELKMLGFEEANRLIRADPVTVCRLYNHKLDNFMSNTPFAGRNRRCHSHCSNSSG